MPAAPRSVEVSQAELEIRKSFGEKEWEDNEVGSSESTHVHGEAWASAGIDSENLSRPSWTPSSP